MRFTPMGVRAIELNYDFVGLNEYVDSMRPVVAQIETLLLLKIYVPGKSCLELKCERNVDFGPHCWCTPFTAVLIPSASYNRA